MGSDQLVYLQTALLTLTIKGPASHPALPGAAFRQKESTLRVSCDDPFEISLAGDAEILSVQHLGRACFGSYLLRPLYQ